MFRLRLRGQQIVCSLGLLRIVRWKDIFVSLALEFLTNRQRVSYVHIHLMHSFILPLPHSTSQTSQLSHSGKSTDLNMRIQRVRTIASLYFLRANSDPFIQKQIVCVCSIKHAVSCYTIWSQVEEFNGWENKFLYRIPPHRLRVSWSFKNQWTIAKHFAEVSWNSNNDLTFSCRIEIGKMKLDASNESQYPSYPTSRFHK